MYPTDDEREKRRMKRRTNRRRDRADSARWRHEDLEGYSDDELDDREDRRPWRIRRKW